MGTAPDCFGLVAGFLAPVEQAALLHELRGLDYHHDSFRGQELKRGVAKFGYTYLSRRLCFTMAVAQLIAHNATILPYCRRRFEQKIPRR